MEQATNQWIERAKTHAVHGVLSNLDVALDAASDVASSAPDGTALASLDRLRVVFGHARSVLSEGDAYLIPHQALDNVSTAAAQASSEVSSYVSSRNPGHLTNANSHADSTLIYLGYVQSILRSSDATALAKSVTELRRAADAHIRALVAEVAKSVTALADVQSQMATLNAEISNQKTRLDNAIAQFSSNASTAEAERAKQFVDSELKRSEVANAAEETRRQQSATFHDERKTAFEIQLEASRARFEALLTEAKTRFDELSATLTAEEDERQQEFNTAMEDIREKVQELLNEKRTAADQQITAIEGEKSKAEKLVHVIGNTGMVGGYQKAADEERWSMWVWQVLTVIGMIGFIIVAVLVALALREITWPGLIGRIFVATSFGVLAAYAGRQAAVHRDAMRKNRRMELELASIDPYIALLPEPEKIIVKKALAERMFAQPEAVPVEDKPADVVALAKGSVDVAKALLERKIG
jgi:hypothetical protein